MTRRTFDASAEDLLTDAAVIIQDFLSLVEDDCPYCGTVDDDHEPDCLVGEAQAWLKQAGADEET